MVVHNAWEAPFEILQYCGYICGWEKCTGEDRIRYQCHMVANTNDVSDNGVNRSSLDYHNAYTRSISYMGNYSLCGDHTWRRYISLLIFIFLSFYEYFIIVDVVESGVIMISYIYINFFGFPLIRTL